MKHLREGCLVALALTTNVTPVAAQSEVADPGFKLMRRTEATAPAAQTMQKASVYSCQSPATPYRCPKQTKKTR
jgi:hypothetical protein